MIQQLGGQKVDLLSRADLDDAIRGIQDWLVSTARGCTPVRFNAQGTADSTGLVEIGGAHTLTGGKLGPDTGLWWSVSRLTVRVDGQPAAYSLYVGGPHTNSLVRDVNGDANGYVSFGPQELLIGNNDNLYIRASSVTAGSTATVSGSAVEIPNQLMWKWLAG